MCIDKQDFKQAQKDISNLDKQIGILSTKLENLSDSMSELVDIFKGQLKSKSFWEVVNQGLPLVNAVVIAGWDLILCFGVSLALWVNSVRKTLFRFRRIWAPL